MLKKAVVTGISLAVLSACSSDDKPATQQAPAFVPVDVATVAYEPVQSWFTFTTRLEAPQEVSLMPRVSGVIETIEFEDGQAVQKGDLLATLDARTFEAEVARLEAQLLSAKASLEQAKSDLRRASKLVERRAISQEQAESRSTSVKQRKSEVLALQAQLKSAKLDLEFTQIYAPISGTISNAFITEGNNVTANQSIISNIVSNDKVYAYFNVDERTWNRNFSDTTAASKTPARLQLTGKEQRPYFGYIDFINNTIDPNTGTLQVRAVFNANNRPLRVGSFGRVQITTSLPKEEVLIPERAIGTDLENRFVLTMNKDHVLQYQQVEVGERYGKYRAITQGLDSDDIIAVNGPAKVGPSTQIQPRNVELDLTSVPLILASAPSKTTQPMTNAQE
ncbi:efflux RND transporter periplasmic adaptor subunit [Vibrio owensii]|uniref:Efflux RND transporter periplasmic adaptor subunit n=1 Tax=Vibrio rotiferianus TaxID=190895 RepID=A0A7Y3Z5L1_9VIBR|nr:MULTISPECIES: efflux RND transporter periplasmic adaptor subunit [Vibrio harveyi group]AYO20030.1 efflux RND transporter periplasmic adaptor subunit [Vibrio owensii]NOH46908.1 efflux RND transporter periplasmic adaptor subunit [Vibrio rotiferianus]